MERIQEVFAAVALVRVRNVPALRHGKDRPASRQNDNMEWTGLTAAQIIRLSTSQFAYTGACVRTCVFKGRAAVIVQRFCKSGHQKACNQPIQPTDPHNSLLPSPLLAYALGVLTTSPSHTHIHTLTPLTVAQHKLEEHLMLREQAVSGSASGARQRSPQHPPGSSSGRAAAAAAEAAGAAPPAGGGLSLAMALKAAAQRSAHEVEAAEAGVVGPGPQRPAWVSQQQQAPAASAVRAACFPRETSVCALTRMLMDVL